MANLYTIDEEYIKSHKPEILTSPMKFSIKNLDIKTGEAFCEILEDDFYKRLYRPGYGWPWTTTYVENNREEK